MPYKDPKKMAAYMRQRRAAEKMVNADNVNPERKPNKPKTPEKKNPIQRNIRSMQHVNPLTPSVNPVNPSNEKYLLSYSRNKYQFVLYSFDHEGRKNLVKSCKKNEVLKLGPCEIQLTWGPDIEEVKE